MLFEESGISPDVAAERGYRTITRRSEVPDDFANWQRRLGLLVPTYSPDGQTKGHQLRPNKPIARKNGNAPKYETPHGSRITLDLNPLMLEEVRRGDADLWLTEGCKKVDSLTSRGLPTVGIIGVWNFAEPGSKSRVPLACWKHVRLRGRRVTIVYDADARTNPDVQEALRRLVAMLQELGAVVLVVYLPAVNGDGKAGVDDYLAAGGTVAELRMMAGPYQPADVGAERMSRDEKLRAAVEDLERRFWAAEWKGMGGASARDVALKLIEAARRSGKIHPDGIRVVKAQGPLALEAKVSGRTLWKSLNRLEEMGFGYRDNKGRKADKSGAFVLKATARANVSHKGGSDAGEGQATRPLQTYDPGDLHLRAPRLRWSRPKYTPKRGRVSGTRKVRQSPKPEPRDRIERLGKIRGAILDALDAAGGSATLQEIAEALHRKRPRDLRRRNLPMLEEAGIIVVNDDVVTLSDSWLEALEAQRELGKEIEAEKLARERYREKSTAYHRRHEPPVSKPSAAGLEAIKRSHVQRRAGLAAIAERAAAAAKSEELRKAEAFVRDRLRELGRIRLALLQDIYRDEGGDPWTIPQAVEALGCRVEELPEFDNRRFVFPPAEAA
jgi:hypothetical protein